MFSSCHVPTTPQGLHKNILVVRHGHPVYDQFYCHHQKFVVVDQDIAFVGVWGGGGGGGGLPTLLDLPRASHPVYNQFYWHHQKFVVVGRKVGVGVGVGVGGSLLRFKSKLCWVLEWRF